MLPLPDIRLGLKTKAATPTAPPTARRRLGLRLVIAYKFAKAPLMCLLALWLTLMPGAAHRSLDILARELAEGGAVWARASKWIEAHLSPHVLEGGAVLAWLDGLSSAIEGLLLLSGRVWAEWIVIIGLAALVPVEIFSLEHRPGMGKVVVLTANVLIVIYLAWGRMRRTRVRVP